MRPLDDVLRDRLEAEEELEGGWAGTVLIEPLTALAGGIIGGTAIAVLAWRATWRPNTPSLLELDRRYLRRRR